MRAGRVQLVSGDRAWDVAVGADSVIEIAGRQYRVVRGPEGTWRVDSGHGQSLVHAASDGTKVWVHAGGNVHVFELGTSNAHAPRTRPGGMDALSAPMPATVREVHVTPGQEVARGDVLVTLEAMKMELPLKAPHAGVVRAVRCARGELVLPGVPLVEIA